MKKLFFAVILAFNTFATSKKCAVIERMHESKIELEEVVTQLEFDKLHLDNDIKRFAANLGISSDSLQYAKTRIEQEMEDNFDSNDLAIGVTGASVATLTSMADMARAKIKIKGNPESKRYQNKLNRYKKAYLPALLVSYAALGYKAYEEDKLADENFKKVQVLGDFIAKSAYFSSELGDRYEQLEGVTKQLKSLEDSFASECGDSQD